MENICPCRRTDCPRHGDCDACRAHHNEKTRKALTACDKQTLRKNKKAAKHERKTDGKRN